MRDSQQCQARRGGGRLRKVLNTGNLHYVWHQLSLTKNSSRLCRAVRPTLDDFVAPYALVGNLIQSIARAAWSQNASRLTSDDLWMAAWG